MNNENSRPLQPPALALEPLPILGELEITSCPDAGLVGRRFMIRREETSIGRATSNTIVISDPDMSAYHARILARDGTLLLIDALSTNGTWVNGTQIAQHHLRAGETFLLGSTAVRFGAL